MIRLLILATAMALQLPANAQEVIPLAEPVTRSEIDRVKDDVAFNREVAQLDIYRLLQAAKFALSYEEQLDMAEHALMRGLPAEAEAAMKPIFASSAIAGAPGKAPRRETMLFMGARASTREDREHGLALSENDAARSRTGRVYAVTGEAWFGERNFTKAAELIEKGIAKSGMTPSETALAHLHLGIAQYRSGRAADARTAWSAIRSEDGIQAIAELWIRISQAP